MAASILVLDSHGLVHAGRDDLDEYKREVACPVDVLPRSGLGQASARPPGLAEVIRAVRPEVLIGTTGQPGAFDEEVIRALAAGVPRPVVLCLSNPSSRVEAIPADVARWSEGRALVATGSPFPAVSQANNVFVFPGLGLGAMVSQARTISQPMFLAAARSLADAVAEDRLRSGALFPPVADLAAISRAIAVAVASEALRSGLADIPSPADLEALVEEAMWHPAYVPYRRVPADGGETLSP
jgi:malic enzyme